jgi:hypothetical protein
MIHQIVISVGNQTLEITTPDFSKLYPVSTAANGVGQEEGSFCTPLGVHLVKSKIGYQLPLNTSFVGRVPEPELFSSELSEKFPEKDWILSRILWLSGCEPGFNRLGNVDSKARYIYIHGTPDSEPMSIPASHGCIRMRCADVAELFEHTPVYTQVIIKE